MRRGLAMAALVVAVAACGGHGSSTDADGGTSGTCGDGVVDPGEACDDGALNGAADDGCTASCTFVCNDPATDCDAAPACQVATCTADHLCLSVPDSSLNGSSCGTDLVCDSGACVPPIANCGDGIVEAGEDCDFGADNGLVPGCDDTCHFSCTTLPDSCDDGDPCNGTEVCTAVSDNGHAGQACSTGSAPAPGTSCGTGKICRNMACTDATCGDGFVTSPEECDDANVVAGDGCENDCTWSCLSSDSTRDCTPADACQGQGTCNDATHTCTPGTPLADDTSCGTGGYCKMGVCTQPVCGNGMIEPGETCDDGALNGTMGDGCKTDCTYVCVDPTADCGTAPECNVWSCTASHTCAAVADATQNGNACNGTSGDVCNNGSCASPAAVCGNGVVETGEQCDFGTSNGPGTGCENNCQYSCTTSPDSCSDGNPCNGVETCGTVMVNGGTGQKCSVGTPVSDGTACGTGMICVSSACVASTCGDNIIDMAAGETCDPPNGMTCDPSCHLIGVCGDGTRGGSEQCDDGNTVNLDGCDSSCKFEQSQRVTALSLNSGTDSYCAKNALAGGLVKSLFADPRKDINDAIATGIADGSITIIFHALGLTDLSGTSQPSFQIGVLGGNPTASTNTTYNGTSDLDWWYSIDGTKLDGNRVPLTQIAASIAAKTLSAGPAAFSLTVSFVGVPVTMEMFNSVIQADIGATSTPLTSTDTMSPGHLSSEHLDPALVSFASASNGKLCGAATAGSLANTHVPQLLTGSTCSQGYTTQHSLLDLYVGGCSVSIIKVIKATQPDTAKNPGDVYAFQEDSNHYIVSCTKNGQADTLADCYANAGYTSYFSFTTDRVIPRQ